MAAMTVDRVLENSAAAEILRKQDAIQAEFVKVQKQIDELTKTQAKMTEMKNALADMVAKSSEPATAFVPDWLDPVKFPSELAVEPSKVTKVHDWVDVSYNAFGVGPGGDATSNPEKILDILYAIQSWTDKRKWENGNRGTVHDVKMTRIALGPEAAYYEGEWGSGVDIYKTTDGVTFELWFHEYEQYPTCYPQLIKGKFSEGADRGSKFVFLAWEELMCTKAKLSDGSVCWIGLPGHGEVIPDEVREMEQECV